MSKQSELVGLARTTNLDEVNAAYSAGALSNRNLIINGAMQVAQRGTSTTGVVGAGYHACDRFKSVIGSLGAYTISQEADGPSGFANSYKMEVTTADASPAAGDYSILYYIFEGQDVQRLGKGTADAEQVTLSFWVKSNKTGTYQVNLADNDNTRSVGSNYSVAVSGTWEKKTITFPADTTGVIPNDNTTSLLIEWWMSSGTNYSSGATPTTWETAVDADRNAGSNVNLADTIGNYFQITGVQLEVGDTATPFEHRSYGQELALCQRYYQECIIKDRVFCSYNNASASYGGSFQWRTVMRAAPTAQGGTNAMAYPSNDPNAVTGRQVLIQTTYADGCQAYLDYDTAAAHAWFVRADSLLLDAEL